MTLLAGAIELSIQSILFPGNEEVVSIEALANGGPSSIFILAITLFIAGIVEEIVKYLGLKGMIYRKAAFNQIFDGVFYAATLAMGFSTVENILYFFGFLASLGGGEFLFAAVSRAIISLLLHITATSIVGYALGKMKFTREHNKMLVLKALIFAILLHGLFNVFLIIPLGGIVAVIITVVVFIYLIKISNRAENKLVWRLVSVPPSQNPPQYPPQQR